MIDKEIKRFIVEQMPSSRTDEFFKNCRFEIDITIGQIHAINAVYVEGVAVAHVDSLATNSFTILTAVYDPGQSVTADIEGFEDSAGDLMENACDIIKFLMNT